MPWVHDVEVTGHKGKGLPRLTGRPNHLASLFNLVRINQLSQETVSTGPRNPHGAKSLRRQRAAVNIA